MKTAPPQPARPPGYRILPLMVLGFCLIATWLVWNQSRRRDEMALWGEFNFMANKSLSAMENHLNANIQVLRGVAALFATSRHVDRHEFHEYLVALEMEELYPGILGIGYSQVIPGGEKERHLARIRGEGFPDYAIHPRGGVSSSRRSSTWSRSAAVISAPSVTTCIPNRYSGPPWYKPVTKGSPPSPAR